METPDLSPQQEAQIEHLIDTGVYTPIDARIAVTGIDTVSRSHISRSNSRRSGNPRIGEGDRDVALGPGGLIGPAYDEVRDEVQLQSEQLYKDSLDLRVAQADITPGEAAALLRAHREHRQRG